jgi:hypothetical protein
MDKALAWVKDCPNPMPERSGIEIRPPYEMADLQKTVTHFQNATLTRNRA